MSERNEIELYLARAEQDLQAAESNLQQGFYAVAVTRAYYAMFYAATTLLENQGISRGRHPGVVAAFGGAFCQDGPHGSRLCQDVAVARRIVLQKPTQSKQGQRIPGIDAALAIERSVTPPS